MTSSDGSIYNLFCLVGIVIIMAFALNTARNSKHTYFHALHLDGFDNQTIEVGFNFWSWNPEFQINGEVIQKGDNENKLVLQRNDGNQTIITWKFPFLGWDAPQIIADGKPIKWIEPLRWYELIWCGLIPLISAASTNGVSLLVLPFSFLFNVKVFRKQQYILMKYILTGVASYLMLMILVVLAFTLGF